MTDVPAPLARADETLVSWRVALAGFCLFVVACIGAWLASGMIVPWDSKNHFYPMFRHLGASLAGGEVPLWNPYHFSGHPGAADPQSLLFTPTVALFAYLFPSASMTGFDLIVMGHLAAGGLATMALFRRRGWHPLGALLAAMIFAIGGVVSSRLQHTGIIISYALFPIALLSLEAVIARPSLWRGALFGLVLGLLALGRDQVAFLACLTVLGAAAASFATSAGKLDWLRSRSLPIAAGGVLAVLIVAGPALLTLQFLDQSNRPAFGFGVAAMGSLPPVSFATFLWPNVFGSLNWDYSYFGPMPETVPGGTWMERASTYLFIGSVPAIMILGFGLARGRVFRRDIVFFTLLCAVAGLYALGWYTPAFGWMFDYVPGVRLYRRPADALFIANFALAMIAGYLLHRYIAEQGEGYVAHPVRRVSALVAAVATAAVLLALAVWAVAFVEDRRDGEVWRALFGFLPIAVAAVVLAFGWRGHRVALAAVLVATTGAELVWRNAANSMNAEPASRYTIFHQLTPDQAKALAVLRQAIDAQHAKGERPRVEILGMPNAWQNAAMVLGIEDTIGYNPLRMADFARAVGPGENAEDMNARFFPPTFRGYGCRLAGLLGLEYLVLNRPVENLPEHFPRVRDAQLLFGGEKVFVYRLRHPAPRVYVATTAIAADTEEMLHNGELAEFDRTREALIEDDEARILAPALLADAAREAAPVPRSARIRSFAHNRIVIEVDSARAGILVLHDLYYPGWTATVRGEDRPVLRANLLFRGVEVPAGRSEVVFTFRPFSPGNIAAIVSKLTARPKGAPQPSLAAQR